jgi:hypothetical protein
MGTMRFTVTYESIDGTSGITVQDVSLYEAMRHLTNPLERVPEGFRETAPRWRPTHKGELTERRTLLIPAALTPSSVGRLARHLKC